MVLTVFETLEYFPVLLHLYWILATSAALLSLLPIGSVKPFRYSSFSDHCVLEVTPHVLHVILCWSSYVHTDYQAQKPSYGRWLPGPPSSRT